MDGCTMKVLYTAEGARGSDRGGRARALKRELDGSETVLPGCYGVTLKPGERVIFYSSCSTRPGSRSSGEP
jgi:N-methylhydantoinase B